jgi:hypothetical protein
MNSIRLARITAAALVPASTTIASAQTSYVWNTPIDGNWQQSSRWAPTGIPANPLATATLGHSSPYTVTRSNYNAGLGELHVTNPQAVLLIRSASSIRVSGANVTNNGIIRVQDFGDSTSSFGTLTVTTVTGTGAIELLATSETLINTAALVTANELDLLINSNGHTIRGTGNIRARIRNEGVILANTPGRRLIVSTNPIENLNLLSAESGGTIEITSSVTQSPNGTLRAGGGGTLAMISASVQGGLLENTGGSILLRNGTVLSDVMLVGDALVPHVNTLFIKSPGITNNGVMRIGDGSASTQATLDLQTASATLAGNGRLLLGGTPAVPQSARLFTPSTNNPVLTNGTEHRIEGTGLFQGQFLNQGTLAPGIGSDGVGTCSIANGTTLTQARSGVMEFTLIGTQPGEFDRMTATASAGTTVNLAGTLRVRPAAGFEPGPGNEFTIITGPTVAGQFETLDFPAGPLKWSVTYGATSVTISAACTADFDGTGFVDTDDFDAFVRAFEAGC